MSNIITRVFDYLGSGCWTTEEVAVGGSQPGVAIVRRFTVAYDAAGLSDGSGYTLFTPGDVGMPAVGDEILDVSVRFPTAFDGTTPYLDIGTGVGGNVGLWGSTLLANAIDATQAVAEPAGTGLTLGTGGNSTAPDYLGLQAYYQYYGPPKITAANPVKAWVTQNGALNGADPVASQGQAEIVIIYATPIES